MHELSIGVLAHVDAGKTTLSESLLFTSQTISSLGRVDHQNSYLDYDAQERTRGITIYSKQARFKYQDQMFNLLDTPGHNDFSIEMERVLNVLDVAVLVVNAHSLVQSSTKSIFSLLNYYQVPTFIFINKMDSTHYSKQEVLTNIQQQLSVNCMDFTEINDDVLESVALNDETLLNYYLETNTLNDSQISSVISSRACFPCIFGSALKNQGVDILLNYLCRFSPRKVYPSEFEAYVYKVSYEHHQRWAHLKILGGSLRVKSKVEDAKIDQIRLYSGNKYEMVDEVLAGGICSVKGLNEVQAGQYIGARKETISLHTQPLMEYQIICQHLDSILLSKKIMYLNDEDPSLNIYLDDQQKLRISLMGEIQQEIIQKKLMEEAQIDVSFQPLDVLYLETITQSVEGVGHYEPMGHYGEVHVYLRPNKVNTGLTYENGCKGDASRMASETLMRYLKALSIKGTTSGALLTDVHIQLLGVETSLKHTQPQDLKQSLIRAIRQGLMKVGCVLLEPMVHFQMTLDASQLSRVIYELDKRKASYEISEDTSCKITGRASVKEMMDFEVLIKTSFKEVMYTYNAHGYQEVSENAEVYQNLTYEPNNDEYYPTGSIFFKHGKGFYVPYDEVEAYMHVPLMYKQEITQKLPQVKYQVSDEELKRVMNATYKPKQRIITSRVKVEADVVSKQHIESFQKPVYMLIDGYNLLFSFTDLKELANEQIDAARHQLLHLLASYQALKNIKMMVVFDAYKQDHHEHQRLISDHIEILFTKANVSADLYIQQKAKEFEKDYQVIVVTSDRLIQLSVLSAGAKRISSKLFEKELNVLIETKLSNYQKLHPKLLHKPLEQLKEKLK